MSGGVTGDWKKLEAYAKRIGNLAGQSAKTAINSALADATLELIDKGFEDERDPSGRPWESKAFPDGRPVLEGRTRRLRTGWRKTQVTASGFKVDNASAADKFRFHQYGTGIYGPKHKRIKPKRKSVLAWPVPGGTAFARSVDGAPPRRMLPDKGRTPRRWTQLWIQRAKTIMKEKIARG